MAQTPAKYAFLKVRDVRGAKFHEEERLAVLIAELKGKLKLAPELAKKKRDKVRKKDKKGGNAKKVKNKKDTANKCNQKQEEALKKTPCKDGDPKEKMH